MAQKLTSIILNCTKYNRVYICTLIDFKKCILNCLKFVLQVNNRTVVLVWWSSLTVESGIALPRPTVSLGIIYHYYY